MKYKYNIKYYHQIIHMTYYDWSYSLTGFGSIPSQTKKHNVTKTHWGSWEMKQKLLIQ